MEKTLQQVIDYMEATDEKDWCMDVVRTGDNRNCCLGHVFAMGKNDKEGNEWMDWFEYQATEFMVYPVNDGKHPEYQQTTPKARVIAYLKDIRDGKQKSTWQLLQEQEKC